MAFSTAPLIFPSGSIDPARARQKLRSRRPCVERQRKTTATMLQSDETDMRYPSKSSEGVVTSNTYVSDINGSIDFSDDGIVNILGADDDVVEEKTKKVRMRTSKLLADINTEPENNLASDAHMLPPVGEDETMPWVKTVIRAGDTRKAVNPVAIRVMRVTYITSFIVALTGKSTPQLRAIANLVEENMFKEHGVTPKRVSGVPHSGWLLLDYGDMMVNVFSPEQRDNYNIEGLWKDGEVADISDCISQVPAEEIVDGDSGKDSLDDWL